MFCHSRRVVALRFYRSKTLDAQGRPNGPIWQTKIQRSGTQPGHRKRTWQPRCNTRCLEWATSTQRSNVERRTRSNGTLVKNARVTLRRLASNVGHQLFFDPKNVSLNVFWGDVLSKCSWLRCSLSRNQHICLNNVPCVKFSFMWVTSLFRSSTNVLFRSEGSERQRVPKKRSVIGSESYVWKKWILISVVIGHMPINHDHSLAANGDGDCDISWLSGSYRLHTRSAKSTRKQAFVENGYKM